MIRFSCPGCAAVYTVPDDKGGKNGKCPKCQSQFVIPMPEGGAAPPPPPAPAPAGDEQVEIAPCPGCQARLMVSAADLGGEVQCPHCNTVYTATRAGASPPKKPSAPAPKPSARADDRPSKRRRDEDEEEEEDRPKKRRRQDDEEEDEDERPSKRRRRDEDEDDEDDRPSQRRRRDEDEDDEEDERPKKKKKKKRRGSEDVSNTPSVVLGICGILGGLLCPLLGLILAAIGLRLAKSAQEASDGEKGGVGVILAYVATAVSLLNCVAGAILFNMK